MSMNPITTSTEKVTPVDLDNNLAASVKRLNELKAGRLVGDIPTSDSYWKALKKHRLAYGGKK